MNDEPAGDGLAPGQPDYEVARTMLNKRMSELGLNIEIEFVQTLKPNAVNTLDEWKCSVNHGDRLLLTTTYFCGVYHQSIKGKKLKLRNKPQQADIMATVLDDAGAIDNSDYDGWASAHGYTATSRGGRSLYQQCIQTGLKLRSALGDSVLTELRDLALRL